MRAMKKSFMVALGCLFLTTGCAAEKDQTVQQLTNQESEKVSEVENLDDLIMISDNIVVGDVLYEEAFNDMGTYKYTFSVKNDLKGNVGTTSIDVYEESGALEKGKEYVLFLEYWESELYPNPVFTSIGEHAPIEINQNKLIGEEKIVSQKTMDEMTDYIKNSPSVQVFSEKDYNVIEQANDLDELVSLSDHVLRIVPKAVIHENKYVKTAETEILENFKGTISEEKIPLNLPADIVLEKEYIIFLKGDESYSLATREGSLISKDNESQWQDALNKFTK